MVRLQRYGEKMSWGVTLKVKDRDVVNAEDANALVDGLSVEHAHQYAVALLSLIEIVDSGALGDPEAEYNVTFSGHGNPGHEITPGWANDHLTISISRA
jgi:hypothetical protein